MSSSYPITASSTTKWRAWWAAESRRCGSDWRTLLDAAEQALNKLRALHVAAASS